MAFDPDDYVRKILAARRLHLALDAEAMRDLQGLLEAHAEELARQIANLPDGTAAEQREVARRITRDLYDRLSVRMQGLTESGLRVQYAEIKREMDAVTVEAIRDAGVQVRTVFQPRPPAQAAAAFLSRGSTAEVFRTLDSAVQGAALGVDDLISEALANDWSPEKLARKIRPFVQGQEPFTEEELEDLRRVPSSRRQAAKQLQFNTRRIAITEMGNAAHEAQVENMREAPMVKATRWRLSPVRGTQTAPDECDILAQQDLYGLGAGVYPVGSVPVRPHPNDRCWMQSVTRMPPEWEAPKPNPGQKKEPNDRGLDGLSSSARERAIRSAKRAIRAAV